MPSAAAAQNYVRSELMLIARAMLKTRRSAARFVISAIVCSLQNQIVLGATCGSKAINDIVIVLDVGHIARQPGEQCQRLMPTSCPSGQTSARGVPEYDFNLTLAQRIKEELVGAGFNSTYVMTTLVNGTSGLNRRADRANDMHADIFLSIHHDGVRNEYLKPWLYHGEEHFFFDDSKGFSLHISPKNTRYEESLNLARMLADQLIRGGLHFTTVHEPSNPTGARAPFADPTRGIYRRDRLLVLSKTEMPAVLLEAGVIVNRDEELAVTTPAYRTTIATAIVEAVTKFCNAARDRGVQGRQRSAG